MKLTITRRQIVLSFYLQKQNQREKHTQRTFEGVGQWAGPHSHLRDIHQQEKKLIIPEKYAQKLGFP